MALVLVIGEAPTAMASPDNWQVFSEPHISSNDHQILYQTFTNHPLIRQQDTESMKVILRLQDIKKEDQTQRHWAQLRFDEQFVRYKIQVQLEVWRANQLLWQRTRTKTRDLHRPGPENRLLGSNVLTPYVNLPVGTFRAQDPLSQIYDSA